MLSGFLQNCHGGHRGKLLPTTLGVCPEFPPQTTAYPATARILAQSLSFRGQAGLPRGQGVSALATRSCEPQALRFSTSVTLRDTKISWLFQLNWPLRTCA